MRCIPRGSIKAAHDSGSGVCVDVEVLNCSKQFLMLLEDNGAEPVSLRRETEFKILFP